MAVDSSIYNALGRGVKTVRDWQVEDEQRQQAAQAQELNALNLGNARATAADNALVRQDQAVIRNALQGARPGATQDEIASLYEGTRTPTGLTQAQSIRKAIAESAKLKAQTDQATAAAAASTASRQAAEYKLQIDKHNTALNDILSFQSPTEAMESLRRHAASGQIPPDAVQAMSRELMGISTPEQFAQWQEGKAGALMDAKGRAEIALRRQEAADRRASLAGEAANRDLVLDPSTGKYVINQPLQNAKVARAAAGAAPASVQPVTYFTAGDGQVYPLPTKVGPGGPGQVAPVTGPGGKPLAGKAGDITEGERNAGGYHARMVEATKLLDKYEESGRQTYGTRALEAVPIVGRAAAGEAMTATQQQYKQAQADWVRAKLRKESGAAIGVDEMAQEIATYFPTPWDGPEVVAQKKQARDVANKAMAGAAGRGVQQQASTAAPAGLPDAAAIDAELARRAKGK